MNRSRVSRLLWIFLAGLLLVSPAWSPAAASSPGEGPRAAPQAAPSLAPPARTLAQQGVSIEPRSCDFDQTTNLATGLTLECHWLTVPEEHANPAGPKIRLAVAIIRAGGPGRDPVPVIFLQGGPGGSTIDTYLQLIPLDPRLREFNRDIILFDQRGTMYTEPALFCEETYQLGIDLLDQDIPEQEADRQYMDALKACRDRLASEGANLSAYDSLENAADVDALRQALGYDKVHLYGVSYGTLLALHVMRAYPEGLASVTLDSVAPPQINTIADQPRVINRGLEALFSACEADRQCSRAFPDLKEVFYQQVDRLNEQKAPLKLTNYEDGKVYPALLDGDTVLAVVIQMLYSTDLLPLIPRTIYQVRAGDYRVLETILSNVVFDRSVSYGMFYSVWCSEENDIQPGDVKLEGLPPQLYDEQKDSAEQFQQTCAFWDVEPLDDVANQAVQSDIPTLVLSGAFDPVTPPEYAEAAAAGLSNHTFVVFPNGGHGAVTSGECQDSIFRQFLDDPSRAPDTSCAAKMEMEFSTPGALVPAPKLLSLLNPQGLDLALLVIFLLALLFLLSAVLVYPLVWIVRLIRGTSARPAAAQDGYGAPASPYAPSPYPAAAVPPKKPLLYRLAPWLAVLTGGMLLVFVVVLFGVALQMALANDNRILFGLPGSSRPLFLLPLLAALSVLLMLLGALAGWARRAGSVWGRIYLSLLTLAGIACVAVLGVFGLLHAIFLG